MLVTVQSFHFEPYIDEQSNLGVTFGNTQQNTLTMQPLGKIHLTYKVHIACTLNPLYHALNGRAAQGF